MRQIVMRWLVLGMVLGLWVLPVEASGRGQHKKLYLVPRPGAVTIDGKLDDWDLSGQIYSYVIPETADMQSARLAMMWDGEALYISGVVRDTSPMMNRHDPQVDPNSAWDADVCQVFMSLDPRLEYPVEGSSFAKDPMAPVGTLYLWYFTDRKEPCLAMYRGMRFNKPLRPDLGENGVVPADKFEAAYVKADDGGGYTFEYRIPYTTIGLAATPKANDILAAVTCVFWSRPDGLKTAGGAAWCYDVMAGPGFPWQSTLCYGKLIFSPTGNIAKELVEEGLPPEKPLPLKFAYDLPEDSQVSVQLFDQDHEVRRILVAQGDRRAGTNKELWDGLDDEGNLLPPGEYTWKGIYHEPIKQKYLFSPHNSGKPTYPTDNNRGGWGGDHGSPASVCTIKGGLLLGWSGCEYGWGIIRVTPDGKKLWGSKHSGGFLATDGTSRFYAIDTFGFHASPGVKVFDLKDSRPVNFANGSPTLNAPDGGTAETNAMTGLAYHKGKVYASLKARNLVAVYNATSGDLVTTWNVPAPGQLAACADGSLVAISGDALVRVNDGKVTPLATAHLDQPAGIAAGADGVIYVGNRGDLQNVSVFAADGSYLRSIGKQGGRPAKGKYDPSGMYMVGGLAVDEQNRLWAAETKDGPKRHSVWDTATGADLTEYFGACSYFGYAYINPDVPDEIYCHNVLWKIDWDANTTTPITTIWRKTSPDMVDAPNPDGYKGVFRSIVASNGRQYARAGGHGMNLLLRRDGDLFKPFAASFSISRKWSLWRPLGIPELDDPEKTRDGAYMWQDANDDQCIQLSEVHRFTERNFRLSFTWIDKDLNVWCNGGRVLRPVKWLDNGQPVYDPGQIEATFLTGTPNGNQYIWSDGTGAMFTMDSNRKPSLAAWEADGTLRWGYPNIKNWHSSLNLPIVKAGRLWGMTGGMGTAGDFTANMTYFGVIHVFDKNSGVYTAAVMRDGRTGGAGPDIGQPEGQNGEFVRLKTSPDGPWRYFVIAGGQDGRVTEVLGLDTVKPLPGGTYVHTQEAFDLAKAKHEEYEALVQKSQRLTISRGLKALTVAQPVSKMLDANRGFEVKAAYDDTALYLTYTVTSPNELINANPEPALIFKGGNCLDIQLGTAPDAPADRKKPAPGDMRILVTRQKKDALAVVYRPKIAGFTGEPIVLKSPTGQETFDSIEVTDQIKLEYRRNRAKDGFVATVTIPHSLTGWQPKPGSSIRLDVGYLFGNAQGTQIATRSYWRNNSFTANVINDVPHESRLEPNEWGEALVE